MAYYDYKLGLALKKPESVTQNLVYPIGSTDPDDTISTSTSPFLGQDIHDNFFNLAKSAIDNTTRITILESYPQVVDSANEGFVYYSGREEREGNFYSGEPLSLTGSVSVSIPYTVGAGTTSAFRLACNSGVKYSNGAIDSVNTTWREIKFDTPATLNNIGDFLTYFNNRLKYEEKGESNSFALEGNVDPSIDWNATFNTSGTKTFNIIIDDGTEYVVSIEGAVGVFDINNLVSVLQNRINTAIGYGKITVSNSGNMVILTGNPDRTTGGIFSFTLQPANVWNWLGLLKNGGGVTTAYDFSSLITFASTGSGPYNIILKGSTIAGHVQPAFTLAVWDKDTSGVISGIMNNVAGGLGFDTGIGTTPKAYYNTLYPLSTYTKKLHFGGDFYARDAHFRNLYLENAFSFSGTTLMENLTLSGVLTGTSASLVTLDITDASVGLTAKKIGLTGPLSVSGASTLLGNVVLGTNSANTLTIQGTTTVNGDISIPLNTLTVGSISLNGTTGNFGVINATTAGLTGVTSSNITVSNMLTATSATILNLDITSITPYAGRFDKGTTNPSATTRMNYNGYLYTNTVSIRNSGAGGTSIIADLSDGNYVLKASTSDIRLKTDIVQSDLGLDTVLKLNPVTYSMKGEVGTYIGFIAQELRNHVPYAVFGEETETSYLTVNLDYIIPVLTKAIQELYQMVLTQGKA